MSYQRIFTEDHRTVMNTKLYDNLQDGIEEEKESLGNVEETIRSIQEDVTLTRGDISNFRNTLEVLTLTQNEILSSVETINNKVTNLENNSDSHSEVIEQIKDRIVLLKHIEIKPEYWNIKSYVITDKHFKSNSDIVVTWVDVSVMSEIGVSYTVNEGELVITCIGNTPVNSVMIEKVRIENYE